LDAKVDDQLLHWLLDGDPAIRWLWQWQARCRDGRWSTDSPYPGRQWFQLEPSGASRWNTSRALRVLQW
jgi:hypothetical protein